MKIASALFSTKILSACSGSVIKPTAPGNISASFLIVSANVPFYLGGTSLLIVVVVGMDTIGQVQSHLFAYQYEALIKKSKLRGNRR